MGTLGERGGDGGREEVEVEGEVEGVVPLASDTATAVPCKSLSAIALPAAVKAYLRDLTLFGSQVPLN